jgi:hypothetical protein
VIRMSNVIKEPVTGTEYDEAMAAVDRNNDRSTWLHGLCDHLPVEVALFMGCQFLRTIRIKSVVPCLLVPVYKDYPNTFDSTSGQNRAFWIGPVNRIPVQTRLAKLASDIVVKLQRHSGSKVADQSMAFRDVGLIIVEAESIIRNGDQTIDWKVCEPVTHDELLAARTTINRFEERAHWLKNLGRELADIPIKPIEVALFSGTEYLRTIRFFATNKSHSGLCPLYIDYPDTFDPDTGRDGVFWIAPLSSIPDDMRLMDLAEQIVAVMGESIMSDLQRAFSTVAAMVREAESIMETHD